VGDGGHVIVRGDEAATGIEAEAGAKSTFDAQADFQFRNGNDDLFEVGRRR
jgi:hypothetical protein